MTAWAMPVCLLWIERRLKSISTFPPERSWACGVQLTRASLPRGEFSIFVNSGVSLTLHEAGGHLAAGWIPLPFARDDDIQQSGVTEHLI